MLMNKVIENSREIDSINIANKNSKTKAYNVFKNKQTHARIGLIPDNELEDKA